YDLVTRRRLHPLYPFALAWILALQGFALFLYGTPGWKTIALTLLGAGSAFAFNLPASTFRLAGAIPIARAPERARVAVMCPAVGPSRRPRQAGAGVAGGRSEEQTGEL